MADSKKYDGGVWRYSLRKLKTATEAVENPLYSNGDPITNYTIKGNMTQNGTPTPSSPIYPSECGELITSGEHTGEYVIPIVSGGVTTIIYLSEPLRKIGGYADTIAADGTVTKNIKRLELTGDESWTASAGTLLTDQVSDYLRTDESSSTCTHYPGNPNVSQASQALYGVSFFKNSTYSRLYIRDTSFSTVDVFKRFLAEQYSAGSPVTVWYVVATPTTESITTPTISTVTGRNNLTVDTAVPPSEFIATWTGWHNASVKEWGGQNWT